MGRIHQRAAVAALATCAVVTLGAHVAEARRRPRFNPRLVRAPLVMTSFVQNQRTDVARNEVLIFRFSAYPRHASLDNRTVRIAAVTPNGLIPIRSSMVVRGARVLVDPSRSQANLIAAREPGSTVVEGDTPEGFGAFQDYIIEIPGPPSLHTLQNRRGRRIIQAFNGTFRTNADYKDLTPGTPVFLGNRGTGDLGFVPPRSGSTGLVDEDATIVFEFSEPMDINTLDPASSVRVERVALGETIPGFVKKDPNEPSGRRFLFVPSLGFGADDLNLQGWDIEVTLDQSITDLAGNPLKRPKVFPIFRTRYVAGKKSASVLSESFADQDHMDLATLTLGGEWNTIEEGRLRGGQATVFPNLDIQLKTGGVARTRVGDPLVAETSPPSNPSSCIARPNGSRVQMLYTATEVGEAAAVTGIGWGPDSNALFAATHPNVDLKIGHSSNNQLGTDLEGNFNVGNEINVYQGEYSIPQALNISPPGLDTGYWAWPTFTSPFEFDGINNLVFDAACEAANNCQILRVAFQAGGGPLAGRQALVTDADGDTASFIQPLVYDIRFQKRRRTTRALSLYYEVASDNPAFAQPIISPQGQPGGVQVVLRMQGAHGKPDPFNPGGFIADQTKSTPFTTDAAVIEGRRFVRFEVELIANLTTGQTGLVESIQLPYEF